MPITTINWINFSFNNLRRNNRKKIWKETEHEIEKTLVAGSKSKEQKEKFPDYNIWDKINIQIYGKTIKANIYAIDRETWEYVIHRNQYWKNYAKRFTKEELDKYNKNNDIQNSNNYEEISDNLEDEPIVEVVEEWVNPQYIVNESWELREEKLIVRELTQDELNELENTQLTDEALLFIDQNLTPKNRIDLWNWTILYTTNKIIDRDWRPLIIWYVIEWNKLHLRLFYRSNSEWWWRACAGMREDFGYSKSEFIESYSYETTTKEDPKIWKVFDNLEEEKRNDSPIMDISRKCVYDYIRTHIDEISQWNWELREDLLYAIEENDINNLRKALEKVNEKKRNKIYWFEFLQNEILKEISVNWILFPESDSDKRSAVNYYQYKKIKNVIELYKTAIPKWLDYKKMKNSWRSYSYIHNYLWKVDVEIYTIERNGKILDFHFARARKSPDKVRIENVTYTWAQINSFWVYDKQINAWPLVAKPLDYNTQCPYPDATYRNIEAIMPTIERDNEWNPIYRDIRGLYQWNPIIQEYKNKSWIKY